MSTKRCSMLLLCLLPVVASAEQIRPGLWEFTGTMQSNGQAMPDNYIPASALRDENDIILTM